MGEGLKAVVETYFGDGGIGVLQLVHDAFFALSHYPFIGWLVEDGLKDAAEGGDAVSAQLGKFFYGLYPGVVFQHEVFKTGGVL